ncbi:unnamed protein product, partial [Oppiella nova]
RRKNSSEFDEESDSGNKYLENSKADPLRGGVDDEDSSDGGFKQRIQTSHPITKTVKQIEKTYTTSGFPANDIQTRQSWKYHQKPPALNRTGSSFDSSDHTYEPQMMALPLKRPTRLYFIDNMETSELNAQTETSHSVDELNDNGWKGMSCQSMSKTPDNVDDNSRNKKHVTFATTHLVRSATVGGINNIHISSGGPSQQPRIGERLVNGSLLMRKTDSIDSFDQRSTASTARLVTDFLPLYRAAMRRAVMKTQATQTDTTSAAKRASTAGKSSRRSIPAYLTLSPRTSRPGSQSGDGFPEDFYGDSDDDDDEDQEEDAQQISLKDNKRTRRVQRARTSDPKCKSKSRRKQRSVKTSPKQQTVDSGADSQAVADESGFQRLDSYESHSESSRIETMIRREDLGSKSSTDSSTNQLKSESELTSTSTTTTNDSSYRSIRSLGSSSTATVVSELMNDLSLVANEDKQPLIDEISDDFNTDVTKRPLIIDPKKATLKATGADSSFTSPDSDNYSFNAADHKACATTQGSSSPPVDAVDSGGSSVYVSANDASPQIEKDRQSGQTTSYETASSQGSRYSSPPSVGHQ